MVIDSEKAITNNFYAGQSGSIPAEVTYLVCSQIGDRSETWCGR